MSAQVCGYGHCTLICLGSSEDAVWEIDFKDYCKEIAWCPWKVNVFFSMEIRWMPSFPFLFTTRISKPKDSFSFHSTCWVVHYILCDFYFSVLNFILILLLERCVKCLLGGNKRIENILFSNKWVWNAFVIHIWFETQWKHSVINTHLQDNRQWIPNRGNTQWKPSGWETKSFQVHWTQEKGDIWQGLSNSLRSRSVRSIYHAL